MSKFGVLISRDFSTRVKGGAYIATTILGMLVFIGIAFGPAIIDRISQSFQSSELDMMVIDNTGTTLPFINMVAGEDQISGRTTKLYDLKAENESIDRETALAKLQNSDYDSLLIIDDSANAASNIEFTLYSKNATDITSNGNIQGLLNRTLTLVNANRLNLSQQDVASLMSSASLTINQIETGNGGTEGKEISEEQHIQAMVLAYFLLFMIYMSLAMYGNIVATGVAEEKSSRIMEVMISSVKPFELMAAKIFGVGLLGILQFCIWIGTGIATVALIKTGIIGDIVSTTIEISALPLDTLIWFGVLFIMGFFFYATIFAAAGASVSRVEDVNQITTTIIMLLAVAFFLAYFSFTNPSSTIAVVCSLIPLLSPMVMFSRIALSDPPLIQIIASVVILGASIFGSLWLTAKIYRVGVLMYGKRPKLKEILRYAMQK